MRDPYAVLGVKRDADTNEIKTAWRAIAKKIHPDQNRGDPNAARRFAEAGEAYELLKDPKRRSRYDMLAEAGRREATIQQQRQAAKEAAARKKAAEENARKVMEELARAEAEKAREAAEAHATTGPTTGNRGAGTKAWQAFRQNARDDAASNEEVSAFAHGYAHAYVNSHADNGDTERGHQAGGETPEAVIDRIFGAQPQFTVSGEQTTAAGDTTAADAVESEPSGSAGTSTGASRPLSLAAIDVVASFLRRLTGNGPQMDKVPDQFAEVRITIEDILKENWVTVALHDGRDLKFRLEPGATDGQLMRLKGQGYRVPGMHRGDAVVTLKVESSPLFRVVGHDIHTDLPVTLENAVLGCRTTVQSPTGPVEVEVPQWSGSDQVIRVTGLGLYDGKGGRGDLVAEIRILLWEKPDAKVTDLMRAMREGLYL